MARYGLRFLWGGLLLSLALSGCGRSEAETPRIERSDIVEISTMSVFGALERETVQFPHDMHTAAAKAAGNDCSLCHLRQENGFLSARFMRLDDSDHKEVMDLYHENCLNCHKLLKSQDKASGPVTCGECHRRESPYASSRQEIGFSKSLHYRHIDALQDNCAACHHKYDETTGKLVPADGQEQACRDCHGKGKVDNKISFRAAAHQACLGCHLEHVDTGPVTCGGCHDAELQQKIARVENPPRLKRNQPDFVLISAAEGELKASKLATVPFPHKMHEEITDNCRVCHHKSMQACNKCHTLGESAASGGVTLQQAMHRIKSGHSCIGCHDLGKKLAGCGGCHSLMEQGRLSDHACPICHTGPKPDELASVRSRYKSMERFLPGASKTKLSFRKGDIPEEITIGSLSDKYEPAVFPHRRMIEKLSEYIAGSKIATHFHGHEDVVCLGCHHHSPVGEKPPLCESCHGQPFNPDDIFKPGLYGAYHRQCLGCHEVMEIGESSGCTGCHKVKNAG